MQCNNTTSTGKIVSRHVKSLTTVVAFWVIYVRPSIYRAADRQVVGMNGKGVSGA